MRSTLRGAILLTLTLGPTAAFSQPRVLGYVNGVCATKVDAQRSLIVARNKYIEDIDERTMETYSLSDFVQQHDTVLLYNQTSADQSLKCLKYDLLESAYQLGWLSSVEEFWDFTKATYRGVVEREFLPEFIVAAERDFITVSEEMANRTQEKIVEKLEYWTSRRQVALLMHSQGNFFGNDSWQALTQSQQDLVGLVSVATPDNLVADSSQHWTHTCDVIRHVPGALLPEILDTPECELPEDLLCPLICHYFETYLHGTKTGGLSTDLITGAIHDAYDRLAAPPPTQAVVVDVEFAQERFPGIFIDVASTDCTSTTVEDEFRLGEKTRLRVFGQNLRDIPMAAFIHQCEHMRVEPIDPNPDVVWREATCTPSYEAGSKIGLIKDFSGDDGNILCNFSVDILDPQ